MTEITKEIRVSYRDYKNKYYGCMTVKNSYDKESKTIAIIVPYFSIKIYGDVKILAKELTDKFGIENAYEFISVIWFENENNENVLVVPRKIIDNVVEELKDKVIEITAIIEDVIVDDVIERRALWEW